MKIIFRIFFAAVLLTMLVACTDEGLARQHDGLQSAADGRDGIALTWSCPVELSLEVDDYADVPHTRASLNWQEGDLIYVGLDTSGGLKTGYVQLEGGKWTIHLSSALPNGYGTGKGYYFPGIRSASDDVLYFRSNQAVYADESAQWTQTPDAVAIRIHLTPLQARLRFQGEAGTEYFFGGVRMCSDFHVSTCEFVVSPLTQMPCRIGSSGYSDYVYVLGFNDEDKREITVMDTDGHTYSYACPTQVLRPASSGSMQLPTADSHAGWTSDIPDAPSEPQARTFTVGGVSFQMVLVEAGTFTMGATPEYMSTDNDQKPAHQVTLTKDYYMGETEVTQALWQAVTGKSLLQIAQDDGWSTSGVGDDYPMYYISWNDVQSFLTTLNSLTGAKFRMPTEAEWEYAARGGKYSEGYMFAGSNEANDVAWHSGNGSSQTHPVKSKLANELGLYDMCGNVREWCADWYADNYPSAPVTDPTGPATGVYPVNRGGSWANNAIYCRVYCRGNCFTEGRINNLGFRLALTASDVPSGPDTPDSSNGHEYVDLGLSVKWATCNVGAEKPEDAGLYFAWGETEGYTANTSDGRLFNWANYKWMDHTINDWKGCTKYTCADGQTSASWYAGGTYIGTKVDGTLYKNLTTLQPEDDAATANWGGSWRMPTDDELTELRNTSNCTWTWTTQGGKKGYKVTSKKNGNSIFLPAAGYRGGGSLSNAGSYGYYWSSSLSASGSSNADYSYFYSGRVDSNYGSRCSGQSVRPVCP